jgi:hypothetical protein
MDYGMVKMMIYFVSFGIGWIGWFSDCRTVVRRPEGRYVSTLCGLAFFLIRILERRRESFDLMKNMIFLPSRSREMYRDEDEREGLT